MAQMEYMNNIIQQPEKQQQVQQIQQPFDMLTQDPLAGMQAANLALEKQYLDVLKHYTEEEIIPKEIKNTEWSVFGKAMPLTFLEEADLPMIDMFAQVLRIGTLMNSPAHKLGFQDSHNLDQTQLYTYLQAKRAIGTNKGKMNERTLQVTQIGQSISTQTLNQHQPQTSVLSKLRGLF